MASGIKPNTFIQMLALAAASVAGVFLARPFYSQPIPWTYAWSNHVVSAAQEKGIHTVTLAEADEISRTFSHVILDARREADYYAGHIPGAMPLPISDLDQHLMEIIPLLSPEQPILVYCSGQDCDESLKLGEVLISHGFTNVHLFAGGMAEWKQAGLPVDQ
ncbi:MAG TPA: rhodanese-like domain-containing protein [Kiritimatiellia bacterium]|nr:rhodanese-like domain-containing protein [Kiritimatiellia bacterium]